MMVLMSNMLDDNGGWHSIIKVNNDNDDDGLW